MSLSPTGAARKLRNCFLITGAGIILVWLCSSIFRPPLAWQSLRAVYDEEQHNSHAFRWLGSPAEIQVFAESAAGVTISGDWRCGFHVASTDLEVSINGRPWGRATLDQTMQHFVWTGVPLQSGRNIISFVSAAGSAPISAGDHRVAAVGVRDLLIRRPYQELPYGHFLFLGGAATLVFIAWRTPIVAGVSGVDALGAGLLAAFGALSLSAMMLSLPQALTGVRWTLLLLAIAAIVRLLPAQTIGKETTYYGMRLKPLTLLLLPAVVLAIVQLYSPVSKYDDLMYHGSRAGYWLGQQSILPFTTHNERQEVFPYAGDLLFAFGVFTTRNELAGRAFVFLAYPVASILIVGILRKRGVSTGIAMGSAWLIASTPLVAQAAIGIKPDLWGLVFTLIALNSGWNLVDPCEAPASLSHSVILLFAVCAATAIKFTFLLLAPLVLLPFLVAPSWSRRACLVVILLLALGLYGLLSTFHHNRTHSGGWFGSPEMAATHRPVPGAKTVARHLARLPFVLFGVPWLPTEGLRDSIQETLGKSADLVGALEPLPLEGLNGWPGSFHPTAPEFDDRYSFLWFFVLLGIAAGVAHLKKTRSLAAVLHAFFPLATGLWLIVALTCCVRWQPQSGIPERLLTPGIVLTLLGAAWLWHLSVPHRRSVGIVLCILIAFHALPFIHCRWLQFTTLSIAGHIGGPPSSVFTPSAASIPPGAKILLFASQSSGDYVLFHPNQGFPTRVLPWGRRPFSEAAFTETLEAWRPDFVVLEADDMTHFHWHGHLSLQPFVAHLDQSLTFRRIPEGQPNIIYARDSSH
jgi:hypothetical protein